MVETETAKDPIARHFRFCDQLNDAALDAASDVAEGFVRYYPGDFARFLDFAISSLQEVRVRTEAAHRRKLLAVARAADPDPFRNHLRDIWTLPKSERKGPLLSLAATADVAVVVVGYTSVDEGEYIGGTDRSLLDLFPKRDEPDVVERYEAWRVTLPPTVTPHCRLSPSTRPYDTLPPNGARPAARRSPSSR